MRVYTITPSGCNPCTEKDTSAIAAWLESSEPGDRYQIFVGEMDEEEYESMPEYMGP